MVNKGCSMKADFHIFQSHAIGPNQFVDCFCRSLCQHITSVQTFTAEQRCIAMNDEGNNLNASGDPLISTSAAGLWHQVASSEFGTNIHVALTAVSTQKTLLFDKI